MRIHGYPAGGAIGVLIAIIVGTVFLCGAIGALAARLWRRRWWIGGLIGLVLGVVLIATLALAHDPYSGWVQPGTGKSCCSDRDCQPVRSYRGDDGLHYIFFMGRWRQVAPSRVLNIPSPDLSSHACVDPESFEIHCFVEGPPLR